MTVALPAISAFSGVSARVGATTEAPAAAPQPAFQALSCSAPTIYNVTSNGNLTALNTQTLVNTPAAPSDIGGTSTSVNAMGITADGLTVYSADMTPTGGGTTTIHVENVSAGTNTNFAGRTASGVNTLIAGGVNPTNGFYYYGGWNSAGTQFLLFAFDPTAHTASAVGTITPGGRPHVQQRRPGL